VDNADVRKKVEEGYTAQQHCDLGQQYLHEKKIEMALEQFESACRKDASCPAAYLGIARVCQLQGAFAESEVMYRKALKLDPRSYEAMNNIAWMHVTLETGIPDAERLAAEASVICAETLSAAEGAGASRKEMNKLRRELRSVLDTLAWAMMLGGKHGEAVALWTRLWQEWDDDREFRAAMLYQIGLSMLRQGRCDEASMKFEDAIEGTDDKGLILKINKAKQELPGKR
jgi:tetratricopeptide (TPR) repeat protein